MEVNQNRYENWISTNKFTSWMNSFVNSEWFIALIGLIVLVSNCFAQEIVCFSLIALLTTLALIISKDTKPLIFILLTFQMAMSYKNGISYNPNPELPTIYDNPNVIKYFGTIGGIVILAVIYNFIIFKQYKSSWQHILFLLPGLIAMSISYLLCGCINHFSINNLLYSASNCFMILGMYIYFSLTIKSDKEKLTLYISKVILYSSLLISLEISHIYLTNNVIVDGKIDKLLIQNGWGISNNFSGYLILFLPFILYLICSKKSNNIFEYFILLLNILSIIFTFSRNGYLILFLEFVILLIIVAIKFRKYRKPIILSTCFLILLSTSLIFIFYQVTFPFIKNLFNFEELFNGRLELYDTAWKSFLNNPIFGKGWFLFGNEGYIPPTSFAPSYKAHNIFLQLFGTTGIVGVLSFIFLLINIFYFSIKNKSSNNNVYTLSIIILICSSLVDNFFFDYGFERYFAIFLVGIAIELKKDKENKEVMETKEAIVNE